jgi:hypothetical protein
MKLTTVNHLENPSVLSNDYVIPEGEFYSQRHSNSPFSTGSPIQSMTFQGVLSPNCKYNILAPEGEGKDIHKIFGFGTQTILGLFSQDSVRLGFNETIDYNENMNMYVYMHQKNKRYIPRNMDGKALRMNLGKYKLGDTFECTFSFLSFNGKIASLLETKFNPNIHDLKSPTTTLTLPWGREVKSGLCHYPYFEEEGKPAQSNMSFNIKVIQTTFIDGY